MAQINIADKYKHEIGKIQDKFTQLKEKRIYELTNFQGDGFLQTNTEQLEKMVFELLYKIATEAPSEMEIFAKEIKEVMGKEDKQKI